MSYHGLGKGQFWQTLLLFEGFIIWGGKWRQRERDVSLCVAFFRSIPTKAVVATDGSFQAEGCSWRVSCLEAPNLQRCSWSGAHRKMCARYIKDASPLPALQAGHSQGGLGSGLPPRAGISLCSTEGSGAQLF